ncbi:MAG: ABC transporter permease [Patescibacteria group bacterium]|jgi:putative ABC transport system permease protein
MLYKDLLQETYLAIVANKARSALTILGIVIGIGSVIAMVSIGQGAKQSITDRIEESGANLLTVSPGQQRSFGPISSGQGSAETLTMEDVESIKTITDVEEVSPESSSRYQITASGNNTNASIYGVYPEYEVVKEVTLNSGMFIASSQVSSSAKVAVLGATLSEDLFGEEVDPVGQSVKINGITFKVIGLLSETGSGMNSTDDAALIPLTVLQRYLSGSETLSSISVKVADQDAMDQVQQNITDALLINHDIASEDDADFSVRSSMEMVEMASSISSTLTMLLGSIAAISLIVGGIGIMNMMLTSVTERTREIGLRKAIGAKSSDINKQFLAESIMLTFIGGIVGIIGGWLASYLITKFSGTATSVTYYSVALAFGVSVVIGVVFGYYPARRASRLNPIDALRYE